ncbi:probable two-component transmembrane sensor [Secundilactobacillus oryzae JCM 18671]|uniref:Probable two-component transmembrane sensor n=1 Tax=Secundilactobacillus oryzae JCM 18671 TaxID=1291743 RepID=A0A081BGZ7_9LACO|nr:hypothetical protein [Secundilactobacillus oryzae]GAK47315.1 probable two-component transmembrane sensor [Secundilactobacillus oryzae JCM 18671]
MPKVNFGTTSFHLNELFSLIVLQKSLVSRRYRWDYRAVRESQSQVPPSNYDQRTIPEPNYSPI